MSVRGGRADKFSPTPFCPHPQRPACRPASQHTKVWTSPYHPWGHRGNWEARQGGVSQCCYMVLHNLLPRGASIKAPTQPFSLGPSLPLPLKHKPLWTLLPLAPSCPVLPYSTSASLGALTRVQPCLSSLRVTSKSLSDSCIFSSWRAAVSQ